MRIEDRGLRIEEKMHVVHVGWFRVIIHHSSFIIGCALAASIASAQPYPERPVRLVVPAAPGGAIDVVGRIVGQKLSEVLGQNVVIDNRAGANNIIGSSPAAFGKFLKEDLEKYARIARAARIESQ